mgnify:CR=1 FL=1
METKILDIKEGLENMVLVGTKQNKQLNNKKILVAYVTQIRMQITNNYLRNQKSATIAVDLNSACTGILSGNRYHSNVGSSTGAVDPGSMFSYENYSVSAVDKSAILSPTSLD